MGKVLSRFLARQSRKRPQPLTANDAAARRSLESDQPDDLGVKIVSSAAESIECQVAGGRSRLVVRIGSD